MASEKGRQVTMLIEHVIAACTNNPFVHKKDAQCSFYLDVDERYGIPTTVEEREYRRPADTVS